MNPDVIPLAPGQWEIAHQKQKQDKKKKIEGSHS
jgi:sarcosine oxidase gamma subunit